MPGTLPIKKQQQLLAQLAAVRQQIREDKERVEWDRAEQEKAEREPRVREEVELLERERAQLEKELAEWQRREKERGEKERAWKPTSECVETPWSSPEAGPSKRHHDDNNNNNIVDIIPKRKRARTETVWAPAKKSCAECKEKRIACLFSVGRSRARACHACARSKTKCTGGQRADKTPTVVISNDKPPVAPASPSTPRKKVALAEKPTEKAGPTPRPSSKARGKKREMTAEREERERKQRERERKEKELDDATAPKEADLPFSRRAQREITILKTLRFAMSKIRQF
ncbi:hypothetical protein BD311DRAFT_812159 [Dichomitus squalens]|uniref:Uncharacterized protein n=1 Tax=Dichomitus squalens TaxID=114155 RepID=A0A4V2JYL8_9APHY|nr:hypothetical protein BD311DRAFT_812159 [Dichomitus squalens]